MDENEDKLKESLARTIAQQFRGEFDKVHLSGHLRDSIVVRKIDGGWQVRIPPKMYDIGYWRKSGVLLYNKGNKSYASQVDVTGGFSGVHANYVERCINEGIIMWAAQNGIKIKRK